VSAPFGWWQNSKNRASLHRARVDPLRSDYAVGYVLARRSAPLGGAGLIGLILPLCLWTCGASFAGAVAAVAVYRFFSLWLPLPAAFAYLSTVRTICEAPAEEREPALT
jgi:hypothetical protein